MPVAPLPTPVYAPWAKRIKAVAQNSHMPPSPHPQRFFQQWERGALEWFCTLCAPFRFDLLPSPKVGRGAGGAFRGRGEGRFR